MNSIFSNIRYQPLRPQTYFPVWFAHQGLMVFFIAWILCTKLFGYGMEVRYAIVAALSTTLFFIGGKVLYKNNCRSSEKLFIKRVFWVGFAVRLCWVFYCYFYFNEAYYGQKIGDTADTVWYVEFGQDIARWIQNGFEISFEQVRANNAAAIDDCGYPFWLAIIYLLVGVENDVFVPMLVKCVVSALSAILIYRIGQRHFGEFAGRVAGIFVALNPNIIYWCGTMYKEAELVFLCCLFVNEMDKALGRNTKLTFKALLPATMIGLYLFFYRSALGLVAFLAMFSHVVLASQKIISWGKKVLAGVMVAAVLLIGMGENIRYQTRKVVETVQSDAQQQDMAHRSKMKGGNSFAKYAGAAVFAPLIFTIPFPTFNMANESQVLQMELSGGNFIKNLLSFFVILSLVVLLFSGEWRKHVFIIAYTCGYLACLTLSNFAHSSRFHMPIWPMLMLFGAFGISLVQQNKKWKKMWPIMLIAEVAICVVWNWFKLKGRGMI